MSAEKNKKQPDAQHNVRVVLPLMERIPAVDAYIESISKKGKAFLDQRVKDLIKSDDPEAYMLKLLVKSYLKNLVKTFSTSGGVFDTNGKNDEQILILASILYDGFMKKLALAESEEQTGRDSFVFRNIMEDAASHALILTEKRLLNEERYEDLSLLSKTYATHGFFLMSLWYYYVAKSLRDFELGSFIDMPIWNFYLTMLSQHDYFEAPVSLRAMFPDPAHPDVLGPILDAHINRLVVSRNLDEDIFMWAFREKFVSVFRIYKAYIQANEGKQGPDSFGKNL